MLAVFTKYISQTNNLIKMIKMIPTIITSFFLLVSFFNGGNVIVNVIFDVYFCPSFLYSPSIVKIYGESSKLPKTIISLKKGPISFSSGRSKTLIGK